MIERHFLDDCLLQLRKLKKQAEGALAQVDDIAATTAREVVGLLGGDATADKVRDAVARAARG